MELRQLRYFVRAVELGSMGQAALDLNIGVSALSQQISRLESELSIRLLQRTSRGIVATDAGLAFFTQAQLTLRHADDAVRAAKQARLSGHVSVGMAPSTASVLGLAFILAMRERYADIRLHVVESLSGNLAAMIKARQLDLAVVFQNKKLQTWSAIPVLEERLFLIGTQEIVGRFQGEAMTPEAFAALPLILPSQTHGLRALLNTSFARQQLELNILAEIDGLALLMDAVRQGLGATIQPGAAISRILDDNLKVIEIDNPVLSRPNFLVSLSDDELSPVGLAARVVLQSVIRQLVTQGHWPGATLY
ncbi:MAG: LysR family transcriptional regulator [Serratia sp. (in: enterobacteria)]|uniref:LysR family transcriptional regulator n=1 Tax=Serratia sp. (in: enterobacteria) TaxID=616 RepID=UPI003F320284